jgi:hypothetical protein
MVTVDIGVVLGRWTMMFYKGFTTHNPTIREFGNQSGFSNSIWARNNKQEIHKLPLNRGNVDTVTKQNYLNSFQRVVKVGVCSFQQIDRKKMTDLDTRIIDLMITEQRFIGFLELK